MMLKAIRLNRHIQCVHQGNDSDDSPGVQPLRSGLDRHGGAGSPGKDLAMEVQAPGLEALTTSDVVYRSLVKGLGSKARGTGRVIMYTCTMDEEQALSRLTSESLRSVGEMDVFLL